MERERSFWLHGGVKVEIRGHNIERFYNICVQRALIVREVDGNTFWTIPKDFKKMKAVARKTDTRIRIKGRCGLPFFLFRNRRRKLLAVGVTSFFLFLYIMSFFIWDISIDGNLRFTDDMLLGYMESVPVVYGMRKSEISCEELEAGIRNRFTEITWVSAEMRGTRLIIRIKENEALLAPTEKDSTACDLIAGKAGEIVRTVVRSGFSKVKEGDLVENGDLLVDGTIPIYDDSQTMVNSHEIHADAEIFAKTVHTIAKMIPTEETLKTRTGKIRRGLFLDVLGHTFYFLAPTYGEAAWEFYMEQEQIKILEDFYLPIYVGRISAFEYVQYERVYTEEDVWENCERYLQDYMEKLSEKGIQILGSDGKIEHGESGWQIGGTITVIEDIAIESPVASGK